MTKTLPAIALLALAAVMAIAGCGSSSNSSSTSSGSESSNASSGGLYGSSGESKPASSSGGASAATVSVGSASGVGQVLVDSKGMTLYYFEKDKKGSGKSACSGACASVWPPLTGSEAKAMSGVQGSMLGTIKRSDGTTQVTYAGWPLYTYTADTKPGEDNGTDSKAFGATWYPLHPNGEKAGH